jgi:hypothetical protein
VIEQIFTSSFSNRMNTLPFTWSSFWVIFCWAFLNTRRCVPKSSTMRVVKYGCQSISLDLRKKTLQNII